MASPKVHATFRKYHRWLGFFLSGIIAVYAISGSLLIFRKTDFLKYEYVSEQQLPAFLDQQTLGNQLKIDNFLVLNDTPSSITFKQGTYNKQTGLVTTTRKDYPFVLAKLVKLHKATTNSPLYILNLAFAVCLLGFVVSAFMMFLPKTPTFKNGLKIALGGFVFAIVMVMFSA
ncbi:hypothetical protein [Glaciecola sp. SC05]|uniref:hypothetical protein n=1 Tax=Glaciecola sp. SC05 TaxID=1987355 RepID=UPI003528216A